jgi:hypothetical protein
MRQEAPFPHVLAGLVEKLTYRPGWSFHLSDRDRGQGSRGLTLSIHVTGPDSYHPEKQISVVHFMPVPPAAFNERSWRNWLFEQILLVEQHEAQEFFTIDGAKPYAPAHGPGNSPYLRIEYGSDTDRRTSFRGDLNPA